MNFRSFWNNSDVAFVLKMVLIALAIVIVLGVAALFWLDKYTHHGDEVVVPNVVNSYVEEASILAQAEGLHLVIADTTYTRRFKLGSIVEQKPAPESRTKRGGTLYVIVNAKQVRQIPLPNLRDISFRQAEATLRSVGLALGNVTYQSSEYKNLVLDMRRNGESVDPGTRFPEGTKIDLVVGLGSGTEEVAAPNLLMKTPEQARALLLARKLSLGGVHYDEAETEENRDLFVVYAQSPRPEAYVREGAHVDIYVTTDAAKAQAAAEELANDEFFEDEGMEE
ncbi:MAG: PASTA domain-containing protein [Paludibacteraceae bacterium]|nr:PASTA domain-containing protein [Paludibacteraceae bacterium]